MEFWRIWNILWRRKWFGVGAFVLFFLAVVLATHLIPPTYEADAQIVARLPDPYTSLASALDLSTKAMAAELDNFDTLAGLAVVRPVLDNVISKLDLKNRKGNPMEAARIVKDSMSRKVFPEPYVEVEQVDESGLLEITATSGDAEEAAAICNTLAEEYIDFRRKQFCQDYENIGAEIQNRLGGAKAKYDRALQELAEFKREIGSVDLDTETTTLLSKISSLKSNLDSDERTLVELKKNEEASRRAIQELNEFRKDSSEIGQDELAMSLKTRLNELLLEKASMEISITKDHPDYKELVVQLDAVGDLLKKQAETQLNSERFGIDPVYDSLRTTLITIVIDREVTKARLELNRRYLEGYRTDLMKIPEWSMQMTQKELLVSIMRDVFRELWAQAEDFNSVKELIPADFRLVNPAVTPKQIKFPKAKVNYVLGVFLGVFWALAVMFFVEYIDIPREERQRSA